MINLKSLTIGLLTIGTLTTVAPTAEANSIIQRDNNRMAAEQALTRRFINNPTAPEFNQPTQAWNGTTTLIEKCEALRHFKGTSNFGGIMRMGFQIGAEHVTPDSMDVNQVCNYVL